MCASSTHDDLARKPTLGDMNDLEGRPGLTLCMSGKSRPRNGKFRTLLLTPPGKRRRALPNAFSLLSGSEVGLKTWDLRLPPAVAKPGSNACAASHAIPVAVLCCCTAGPAVRIWLLTCGAKGTRTPAPLLANNRQHVHPRPSPQVTVPGCASASTYIQICCGTFQLYSQPWSGTAQIPCDSPLCSPQEHERTHFKPTC